MCLRRGFVNPGNVTRVPGRAGTASPAVGYHTALPPWCGAGGVLGRGAQDGDGAQGCGGVACPRGYRAVGSASPRPPPGLRGKTPKSPSCLLKPVVMARS